MKILVLFFATLIYGIGHAQKIESLSIETTEGKYLSQVNSDSAQSISFLVQESEETIFISGQLRNDSDTIILLPSAEYQILDSIVHAGRSFFVKIQFRDVIASRFLKLIFSINGTIETVSLSPYSQAVVECRPESDKLIIGEQKEFKLYCSIPNNILPSKRWTETPDYDYFVTVSSGKAKLSILPKITGMLNIDCTIHLRQPVLTDSASSRKVHIKNTFTVERSKLVFLNFDNPEYVLTPEARTEGIRTLVDNSILLQNGRTYRITNNESNEETLIGELFVPQKINRSKAEAILKLYNYHQRSEGYLYIKDVDEAIFATNITVRPETAVHNIFTKRSDGIWRNDNIIYPGESLRLKLEGASLMGEPIRFEGGIIASLDSLLSDDGQLIYDIQVPKNVALKKIDIIKNKQPVSKFLEVVEVQIPRKFDFITIDYGGGKKRISDISKPIFYGGSLEYFTLRFNPDKIDESAELHGMQYFTIQAKLYDKENKLIENADIGPICICPGANSVRYGYYDENLCWSESIELNDYLHNHTANLDDWASVVLDIKHVAERYEQPVYSSKVEIFLKRKVNYDLDLSFPTGLLTKEFGNEDESLNNFSGISLAMVAQISFYQKDKIAKYRPYKIGIGFLAFNMFSMSAAVEERDLGLVILGSVYPSTKDRRLSFPLFLGGGYFLSKERFFLLVGPGIRISI